MPSESTSVTINTSQARQNVKQLNAEIRALESGFKAATAGMGSWSESMTGNEARQKALTDILEAQGEKIEMLNALYDDAVQKYGENSVQANNLKTQINNETAAMVENQGELAEVNNRLEEMSDAAGDAGDETGDLSDALDDAGGSAGGAAGSIGDFAEEVGSMALDAAVSAVKSLAGALWDAVTAGYAWATNVGNQADNWNTMATVTGISAEKLQEWSYASRFVDTDLGTITGSMRRLTMAIGDAADGNDTAIGKFDKLGVSFKNADGTVRDTEAVFWDCIDALGGIENATARDAAAMDIFGRSAQDLNPLIKAGRDEWQKYADEAHEKGIVLTQDQLDTANALNDTQNSLTATAEATANLVGVTLAEPFRDLLSIANELLATINSILGDGIQAGDGTALVDALKKAWAAVQEWWKSPEVTEVLSGLAGIGTEIFQGLLDILTSEESAQMLGEAWDMITSVFDIEDENGQSIGEKIGSEIISGIGQGIWNGLANIGDWALALPDRIGLALKQMWNDLIEATFADDDGLIATFFRDHLKFDLPEDGGDGREFGGGGAENKGGGAGRHKPTEEQPEDAIGPLEMFLQTVDTMGGSIEDSGKNLAFFEDMVTNMSDAGIDASEQLMLLCQAMDELTNQDDGTDLKGRWTEYADTWNSEFDAAASSAAEAGADAISASADSFAASGAACAAAWLAGANSVRPGAAKTFNSARLQRAYGVTRK